MRLCAIMSRIIAYNRLFYPLTVFYWSPKPINFLNSNEISSLYALYEMVHECVADIIVMRTCNVVYMYTIIVRRIIGKKIKRTSIATFLFSSALLCILLNIYYTRTILYETYKLQWRYNGIKKNK